MRASPPTGVMLVRGRCISQSTSTAALHDSSSILATQTTACSSLSDLPGLAGGRFKLVSLDVAVHRLRSYWVCRPLCASTAARTVALAFASMSVMICWSSISACNCSNGDRVCVIASSAMVRCLRACLPRERERDDRSRGGLREQPVSKTAPRCAPSICARRQGATFAGSLGARLHAPRYLRIPGSRPCHRHTATRTAVNAARPCDGGLRPMPDSEAHGVESHCASTPSGKHGVVGATSRRTPSPLDA